MATTESISVFDIFKIGVGPSSSHTLGPWRACRFFVRDLRASGELDQVKSIRFDLYGSLAKTGKGHGTDIALQMGILDLDPEEFDTGSLENRLEEIKQKKEICLGVEKCVSFDPEKDIYFHFDEILDFHPNGMRVTVQLESGETKEETYFSVGGGFVVTENERPTEQRAIELKYPIHQADDLVCHVKNSDLSVLDVIMANERVWKSDDEINARLDKIWGTMLDCIVRGCHTDGILPGGLNVSRRAKALNDSLLGGLNGDSRVWMQKVKEKERDFNKTLRWVSCFAIAVNEENAAFGQVVTAPTNGAAGVIPAVMMFAHAFENCSIECLREFLLIAGQVGIFFKKGATISAAMGGCMAEIGVSSSMAAAGLTHVRGGSLDQVLMAAEIAMEHHLGMTCDPIAGLVQIPCIERNTMGAVKAITASEIALNSDPSKAKVTLDGVIKTMWDTAVDMNAKYKETSEGGLAVNIPVIVPEC